MSGFGFRYRTMRRVATALALTVLIIEPAGTAAAIPAPTQPICGQVLVRSTVLTGDMGPCVGDGLVVGADNITVNLNGHRVVRTSGPSNTAGIRILRRTGVVVRDGTVSGFGAGVAIMGGSGNTVKGVTAQDNVGLIDGSGDFGDGLAIFNSRNNILSANTVRHNGPFDGIGVFGTLSTGNQIARNLVELNNIATFAPQVQLFLGLDDGINLGAGLGGGSHTTVVGNTVRRNGFDGIDACSDRGNPCITTDDVIAGNLVQANGFGDPLNPDPFDAGDGIHIVSIRPPGTSFSDFFPPTRELVAGNTVLGNAGSGITVGSSNNRIMSNRSLGNGTAIPDLFFDLQDISINNDCDANVWRGNTYTTADPSCVTAGGRRVPAPAAPHHPVPMAGAPRRPAGPPVARHFPLT